MNIRRARPSDKNMVLDLCMNTFEWGDYIDKVWDNWISDPLGLLLVYESTASSSTSKLSPLGIIHIVKCLDNILWLEGLRVNKIHRNKGIATALLKYSLDYGSNNGIEEYGALVSENNFASQNMMEKFGFSRFFEYNYYNINLKKYRTTCNLSFEPEPKFSMKLDIQVPHFRDLLLIREYLSNPDLLKFCPYKYFDSWRLYNLKIGFSDLFAFLRKNELLMIVDENKNIVGIVIVKPLKIHSFYDTPMIQISYLNCINISILQRVIQILLRKYCDDTLFNNAHFLLPFFTGLDKIFNIHCIQYTDRFYLYSRSI